MGGYGMILIALTLLASLHFGTSDVTKVTLTEGDLFTFPCSIVTEGALDLFAYSLKYFYYNPAKSPTPHKLTDNSQATDSNWKVQILEPSNNTHFNFELAKTVNLADSGTYYCSRVTDKSTFNKTIVLTVNEKIEDVGQITFSIAAFDGGDKPIGDEIVVTRTAGSPDPAPKEVHIDSGYYQANCRAEGGIPAPTYILRTGETNLEYGQIKKVLLNSGTPDLSCHIDNSAFTHHLQFKLTINAGHPEIYCTKTVTKKGATDAEIDCLVSGKELDCSHFSWLSETDMTSFNQKANYTVECTVREDRMQMKNILKFSMINLSHFDDGYILKFENHLGETFQKVNKLEIEKEKEINAGNNLVPMGTITMVFLSILGLVL